VWWKKVPPFSTMMKLMNHQNFNTVPEAFTYEYGYGVQHLKSTSPFTRLQIKGYEYSLTDETISLIMISNPEVYMF
jgi:hypothetical protein